MAYDIESWQNVSRGKVLVNKFDHNRQVVQEVVHPGRQVLVSPQERTILNSDRTYAVKDDVFQNGLLIPLILASDSGELKENPNHMNETQMRGLFSLNWKTFDREISAISSPPVLQRLLEMIEDPDDKIDPTTRQRDVVEQRLKEVSGTNVEIDEIDQVDRVSSDGFGAIL